MFLLLNDNLVIRQWSKKSVLTLLDIQFDITIMYLPGHYIKQLTTINAVMQLLKMFNKNIISDLILKNNTFSLEAISEESWLRYDIDVFIL